MALRAGTGAEVDDLDAVVGKVAAVAHAGGVEELHLAAAVRLHRRLEGAHGRAVLGREEAVGAGQELDAIHGLRLADAVDHLLQLLEGVLHLLVGQQAAVDLDGAGRRHDVGVVAAMEHADVHRRLHRARDAIRQRLVVIGAERAHEAHHAQDGVVAGRRIAGMGGAALGGEARPHHAALGHDQVVLGLRAQDQGVRPDLAALAQILHAFGPEILLVGHEGEDQLAGSRAAAAGDLLGDPDLHGHAALAVAGAQTVDQTALDQRLVGIALPVGALADAHRVDMGVEGNHGAFRLALHPRHDIVDALLVGRDLDLVARLLQTLGRIGADLDRSAGRVGARQRDQVGQDRYEFGLHLLRHEFQILIQTILSSRAQRGILTDQQGFLAALGMTKNHRLASSASTSTSTRAPAARSCGVAFSISLWLIPRSQGTKIMPAGQRWAMCMAS